MELQTHTQNILIYKRKKNYPKSETFLVSKLWIGSENFRAKSMQSWEGRGVGFGEEK